MEEKNMQSDEKQAAVPYFIHEGDMTRMDMAMEKLQQTSKDALEKMQENTKQMKSALLIVCVTLIVAVTIFVAGYSWNNNRWMEYTKALQAEGAGHGDQQTEIHELPDPGIDP